MSASVRDLSRQMSLRTGRSVQACRAELRRYGYAASEVLLPRQESCCAICGTGGKLVVDHDHVTGEVRGMLCPSCNNGLGLFKDSVVHLRNAISYLGQPPARAARPSPPSEIPKNPMDIDEK